MSERTLLKPTFAASARDAGLSLEIETALEATGHPQLNTVNVSAHKGLVTLKGRVDTYYQKQLAQSTAMSHDGVDSLRNEIVVT